MSNHRSKRISEDEIEYRGHVIRRRDEVPTGYYGRYTTGGRNSFAFLREAKAHVGRKLDQEQTND